MEIVRDAALPPLAWLLTVRAGRAAVRCGSSVETIRTPGRQAFFEGCWDGAFAAAGFEAATCTLGSGGFLEGGRLTLVTPTHPLDSVFVFRGDDAIAASNSLAFLLRHAGLDAAGLRDLPRRHNTVLLGLDGCERVLFEAPGQRLERHVRSVLTLEGGAVAVRPSPEEPPLPDFAAYRARLKRVMRACAANADDPGRRRRYALLATITRGYDSPPMAALAKAIGCREAIGVASGRYGLSDSGREAAEALGLECRILPRPTRATSDIITDAEFLAAFCPGDRFFAALDGLLAGRLLVTGHHGGAQWSAAGDYLTPYLRKGGGSGMGLRDFRLRNDFLVLPVPMIGASRPADIQAISTSAEMAPFRTGGGYDRPIPRRIGLEAGLPLSSFGVQKVVASRAFWEWGFAPETVRAADAFAWPLMSRRDRVLERLARLAALALRRLSNTAAGASATTRLALMRRLRQRLNQRPYRDLMTLWALDEVGARYALAPRERGSPRREPAQPADPLSSVRSA